jgi:hypothetical protein
MRVTWLILVALLFALPASAAPSAEETPEGVTLENGVVRAVFPAKGNYVLADFRRVPDGENLLSLCILSYTVEGAQYWYQDNKTDADYGLKPVTTRVERGDDFARLVVSYPAQGAAKHFRVVKTHTLRDGSPVLENDYRLEATTDISLRGGLNLPLIWFAPRLSRGAVPSSGGSLLLGPGEAVRRDSGTAPWVAACDPETGEGIAFCLPDREPQLSRSRDSLAVVCTALSEGKVPAQTQVRITFHLAAFAGQPVAPALAAALTKTPGITGPVRFRQVYDMGGERFDPADLSLWQKHRASVRRPIAFVKPADLERARENVRRHAWAKGLLAGYRGRADYVLKQPPEFVEQMIPALTPLCTLFTMCPHCEYAPVHGQYIWDVKRPDELKCRNCGTVYPNEKYPEDLVLIARYGGEQRFTFYGGKSWNFNNIHLRSSWTGAIRAHKTGYMARAARDLAMVYALTGERAYGEKAAAILSRFAIVYPGYLLHSGYGEIADMDPRVAAAKINSLPADELTCPPNKPDRRLHAGYWMAGRGFSAVGMEGIQLSQLVEAYDLVADLIPDAERQRIEKDLFLEGTYLLVYDTALNNKTATNRSAVGQIGMAIGDPRRVRFGLAGLRWFINEWFLPDGAACESPSYGNMTLAGIWQFADTLHGYSDPPGYQDAAGRIDNLDIYGEARYRSVFQVLAEALLPSRTYPPIADTHITTGISLEIAEVMATRYPDPRFRALLNELAGGDLSAQGAEWALFHRDPEPAPPVPPMALPDQFFPAWKIGFLRSGKDGRRGAAVVSASDWGGHHHLDSLNLFYWQDGVELLSDLGYLWDNPDMRNLSRTVAHNLVVVDEANQRTAGRGGWLHAFDISPRVKVIEVASGAYPQASDYRRTVFLVEHPEGVYLADIFRTTGGKTHDYVFHGPNPEMELEGLAAEPTADLTAYQFTQVRASRATRPWRALWTAGKEVRFQALSLPQPGESSMVAQGWGQRVAQQKGWTLPYIIRRIASDTDATTSAFTSVFEGYRGQPFVRAARRLEVKSPGAVALAVETATGGTDYIVSAPEGTAVTVPTHSGPLAVEGGLAMVATAGQEVRFASLVGGKRLEWNGHRLLLPEPILRGKVARYENDGPNCWLELDRALPNPNALIGRTILAGKGEKYTGYEIRAIEGKRIYVRKDGAGVDLLPCEEWRLVLSASLNLE